MTEYSERSQELAEQLRAEAIRNLQMRAWRKWLRRHRLQVPAFMLPKAARRD